MSHETLKFNRLDIYDPSESEILISFKYHAGRPMVMYLPNGDPGYPEEPDEIEILKIETASTNPVNNVWRIGHDITDLISEAEFEYIETYIYENWAADKGDDDADYRYERYREERDRE